MGKVEACSRYGAVTVGGECEVKTELEIDTRQDVWDEACRVKIAFNLRNIVVVGIHEAGNSQSKRDSEHRLHSYQVSEETGRSAGTKDLEDRQETLHYRL